MLLGTLISTPLVLRIFQSEINAQMAQMQQKNYSSFLPTAGQPGNQQVTTYYNELQQLNKVIRPTVRRRATPRPTRSSTAYNKQLTKLQHRADALDDPEEPVLQRLHLPALRRPDLPEEGTRTRREGQPANYQNASQQVTRSRGRSTGSRGRSSSATRCLPRAASPASSSRYQQALNQQPIVQSEYDTAVQRQEPAAGQLLRAATRPRTAS